jgi:two-component system chemotaxis response regulator CheB
MARDIVVIGASAGGVEALTRLVAGLPAGFPAAVFVVLHVGRTRSVLPEILNRTSRMPVLHAADQDPIVPGRILVAPPDAHLVLESPRVRLSHGPEENGCRPAIDPLFRSAARAFGQRVVGVILTGALDDGVAGLVRIKAAGGLAVVQDPQDAAVPSMPASALQYVDADYVVPMREMSRVLRLAVETPTISEAMKEDTMPSTGELGIRSALTCPSCSGSLWEIEHNGILQFRCRVGHVYSSDAMLSEQAEAVDRALWAGLRALEERAALEERMAAIGEERGQPLAAARFREKALRTKSHAATLRGVVTDPDVSSGVEPSEEHEANVEVPGGSESQ